MNLDGLPPFRDYGGFDGGCRPSRLSKTFRPKKGDCRPKPLFTQQQLDNATEEEFIRMGRKIRGQTRSEYHYMTLLNGERRLIRKHLPAYHPNVWGIYRTQDKRRENVPRPYHWRTAPYVRSSDEDHPPRSRPMLLIKDKNKALPEGEESSLYDQLDIGTEREPVLAEGSPSDAVEFGAEAKLNVPDPLSVPENNELVVEGSPCDPLDEKESSGKSEEKMSNKRKRRSIVMSPARIPIKKKKIGFLSLDKKFDALIESMIKRMANKKFDIISEDKEDFTSFVSVFRRKTSTFKKEIKRMMKSYITKNKESSSSLN